MWVVYCQEVENLKKMNDDLRENQESETIRLAACEKNIFQLNHLVQQLKEEVAKLKLQKGKLYYVGVFSAFFCCAAVPFCSFSCHFIVFFISAAVPSNVKYKRPTCDCAKKAKHRKGSKLSSGTLAPFIFGSKCAGPIGSVGVQLQQSAEVAAMSGAESAKMNSSTSP